MTRPLQVPEGSTDRVEVEGTTWEREAYIYLSVMLTRKRVTYKALASKLQKIGVDETERSVATKINRGTFSFVFFVQVMRALKMTDVEIGSFGTPTASTKDQSNKQE